MNFFQGEKYLCQHLVGQPLWAPFQTRERVSLDTHRPFCPGVVVTLLCPR